MRSLLLAEDVPTQSSWEKGDPGKREIQELRVTTGKADPKLEMKGNLLLRALLSGVETCISRLHGSESS